jgi:hypothetical protein
MGAALCIMGACSTQPAAGLLPPLLLRRGRVWCEIGLPGATRVAGPSTPAMDTGAGGSAPTPGLLTHVVKHTSRVTAAYVRDPLRTDHRAWVLAGSEACGHYTSSRALLGPEGTFGQLLIEEITSGGVSACFAGQSIPSYAPTRVRSAGTVNFRLLLVQDEVARTATAERILRSACQRSGSKGWPVCAISRRSGTNLRARAQIALILLPPFLCCMAWYCS